MKKILSMIVLMIILVSTISGCGATSKNQETVENEKDVEGLKIRVGGCDFAIWNPQVNIAIHTGLFEEEFAKDGITIESYNFANGPAGNEAFAAGELDIFNGTGDQPFVTAVSNDVPVVLLSTTSEQGKGNHVIVSEGSDIFEASELKGKRIGLYIGTQEHKVWLQYLSANGISEDEVEFVNLQSFTEQYAALSNNEIDAFYASEYNYRAIEGEGIRSLGDLRDFPSRCYITARKGFIDDYPDIVQRFFQVLVKAQKYIDENPEQAYEYLAEDSGLSVDDVRVTVEQYRLFLSLDEEIEAGIQDTYNFLKGQGILETDIENLSDHYNSSFVTNASK